MTQPSNQRLLTEAMADEKIAGAVGILPATTTSAGKVQLATNAETITGTDTGKAVTPAGAKALWGSGASITTVTDWNNATTTGFYTAPAGTLNGPGGGTGIYQGTVTTGNGYIIQNVVGGNFDNAFKRVYTVATSSWAAWISEPSKATTPGFVNSAVPVNQGGTGVTTLTGIAKGNGTGVFTAATAGTDYSAPGHTHAAADVLGGTSGYVLTSDGTKGVWQAATGGGTGGTISLVTITDWNSATDTGFYRGAAGTTNAPEATNSYHAYVTSGPNMIVQILNATTADISYRRVYTIATTTWGSWTQEPTASNTPSLTAGAVPVAQGGTGGTTAAAARTGLGLGALSTLGSVSLASGSTTVSGTLPLGSGGTGQTTQQAALNALTGTQTSGRYLRSDGTNSTLSAIASADIADLAANGRLGTPTTNLTNGDWNNATTTGLYRGSTMTNAPVADNGWCWVIVQQHDTNWISQIAHGYTGGMAGNVYQRFKNNGTWTSWTRLEDSADNFDIARITHSSYNSGGANGFWQGYMPATYYNKTEINAFIADRPVSAYGTVTLTPNTAQTKNLAVSGGTAGSGAVAAWTFNSIQTTITFPAGRFSATPSIICGLNSGAQATLPLQATAGTASATGFTLTLLRADTTSSGVWWIAAGV